MKQRSSNQKPKSNNLFNFSNLPKTQQDGLGCWGLLIVTLLFLVILFTDGSVFFFYATLLTALLGTVQFAHWLRLPWLDGVLVLSLSSIIAGLPAFVISFSFISEKRDFESVLAIFGIAFLVTWVYLIQWYVKRRFVQIGIHEQPQRSTQATQPTPTEFEQQVALIYSNLGYKVIHTGQSGDHGIDLIVYPPDGQKWVVQCKRYAPTQKVSEHYVRDLWGVMHHENAQRGFIFTTSDFTEPAYTWARGKSIDLINAVETQKLMNRAERKKQEQNYRDRETKQESNDQKTANTSSNSENSKPRPQKDDWENKEPHEILDVTTQATKQEVITAYRKLAQMYHPDKVAGLAPEFQEIAEKRMKSINDAYSKLMRTFN